MDKKEWIKSDGQMVEAFGWEPDVDGYETRTYRVIRYRFNQFSHETVLQHVETGAYYKITEYPRSIFGRFVKYIMDGEKLSFIALWVTIREAAA